MNFNIDKLAGLYFDRVPTSNLSNNEASQEIARLLTSMTYEEVYFSISYVALEYPHASVDSIYKLISDLWGSYIKPRYEIATLKREAKKREEELANYDSRNEFKPIDTPKWFGKGFDKYLFE